MHLAPHDINYLICCEKEPFYPTGWLYRGIFEDLELRGLVRSTPFGAGFVITDAAKVLLAAYRNTTSS